MRVWSGAGGRNRLLAVLQSLEIADCSWPAYQKESGHTTNIPRPAISQSPQDREKKGGAYPILHNNSIKLECHLDYFP